MANKLIISQTYLQGKSKYIYCPFCLKQMEQDGISWEDKLKPLKFVKTAEPIKRADGSYWDYIDFHYECSKCGNTNITTNTFINFYCERYDGTSFNEPRKEPGLVWSKTKDKLVPAKWNIEKRCWEEILDKSV